jgi:hypothetical protein
MWRSVLAAIGLIVLITTPALASGFYLVQNTATKHCRVFETQPDGKKWVMVGTTTYPTLAEAWAAKKANPDCLKINKTAQHAH